MGVECVYIIPLTPGAVEGRRYVKALEDRVAELESTLASYGAPSVGEDHFRLARLVSEDEADEGNEVFVAVRDLSMAASGHYVGGTSNIAIGRVLSSVVQSQQDAVNAKSVELRNQQRASGRQRLLPTEDPAPKSADAAKASPMVDLAKMDPHTADRLVAGWHRHIGTRYLIIQSPRVSLLNSKRSNLADIHEKSLLHLVYAVSGRWLESAGETGYFWSNEHYEIALKNMDIVLRYRDVRSLDYLLLMTLYCTRAPRDPGAWTFIGMAMRLCIELGLHRRQRHRQYNLQSELNKRRFWTAYFLDRDISIAIGRPPSISDHDIDIELPLDVDEAVDSNEVIRAEARRVSHGAAKAASSLTPFIHRTRLKQIESEIQHTIYRVDRPVDAQDPAITQYLDRLEAWRAKIPSEARNYASHNHKDAPFDGMEFYSIHYHRCVRFLLYPQLSEPSPNMHYLRYVIILVQP